VVFGGTSAGLAIMGNVVYQNRPPYSIESVDALANPYHYQIEGLPKDYVQIPLLKNRITDTHFGDPDLGGGLRDRMGRLLAFLGRMKKQALVEAGVEAWGLGVGASTAVLLETNGKANVVGSFYAYFLETAKNLGPKDVVASGQKLLTGIPFVSLDRYEIRVDKGVPEAWANGERRASLY
jgi:cyanophycinase